jgi:hypothetical protein
MALNKIFSNNLAKNLAESGRKCSQTIAMRKVHVAVGLGIAVCATLFTTGCHRSSAQANALLGTWKITAPVLGSGTITFDESQFTERWPSLSDDDGTLVISGPFQLNDGMLHLNPKQFGIEGRPSASLTKFQDDLKKARAWDFSVQWSRDDMAYLNATNSFDSTVTMAITRGEAKPNPGKLAFAFSYDSQSNTAVAGPGGTFIETRLNAKNPPGMGRNLPNPVASNAPPTQSSAPPADGPTSNQSVTIETGPGPDSVSPDQDESQPADAITPPSSESTPDQPQAPPSQTTGDVQRF